MKEIFNREAMIVTALMFAVLVGLLIVLHFTDNTEALKTCSATRSVDVCEFTLNP